jgi:hypothetical protein
MRKKEFWEISHLPKDDPGVFEMLVHYLYQMQFRPNYSLIPHKDILKLWTKYFNEWYRLFFMAKKIRCVGHF